MVKNQKLLNHSCINITYSAFVKMQNSWNDNKMQVIPERVIFRFKHALTKNVISIFICKKKNRDRAFCVFLTFSIWNYNRLSFNNFEKRFLKNPKTIKWKLFKYHIILYKMQTFEMIMNAIYSRKSYLSFQSCLN